MTMENSLATRTASITEPLNRQVVSEIALSQSFGGVRFMNMVEVMDFAKLMSHSDLAVPKHLRSNPGACLAVVIQSIEMGMSPFAVANKSYVVNDRLAYESAIYHAVAVKRVFKGRIKPEYAGDNGTRKVRLTATLINGETVEYTSPEIGRITTKNSPVWKSDPDQQLFYYSVRAMVRRFFPDVMMGIYTDDELLDSPIESTVIEPGAPGEPAIVSLDQLGDDDPPHESSPAEPPAPPVDSGTTQAAADGGDHIAGAGNKVGDDPDVEHEEESPDPPPIPVTHEHLVDSVSRLTGLDMTETAKRLKLALPKDSWGKVREKSGFWSRFLEGQIVGLMPLNPFVPQGK